MAEFDGKELEIGPGYVIFVPAGAAHNMSVSEDGPMELLFFFDKPGADEWFREAHERYFSKSIPLTVEACNEIGEKYDYVCIDNEK
jgi:plastocyanin